jgi:hypothetical protein
MQSKKILLKIVEGHEDLSSGSSNYNSNHFEFHFTFSASFNTGEGFLSIERIRRAILYLT